MTKKERPSFQKTKEYYDEVLPLLQEKYPLIFRYHKPRPLARRIAKTIIRETGIESMKIYSFLAIWCSGYHYQVSLVNGLYRYDLMNKSVAFITWEERHAALEKYHNYLMKRQNGGVDLVEPCPVFTKENMAREMYNHYEAHRMMLAETGAEPTRVEHFFDVYEINFLIIHYKGDRDEDGFKQITTAYLKLNEGQPTSKSTSAEVKNS